MRLHLSLLLGALFFSPLHADPVNQEKKEPARVAKEQPANHPLPTGMAITGKYSVEWDEKKNVIRFTGLMKLSRGGSSLTSLDDKNWLEISPDGRFRASKGKWETIALEKPKPDR